MNSETKKISVAMATYNGEKYIKEQFEELKLLREFGKEYGVTGLIKDTNTKNICFYPSETDKRFIIIGLPEVVEKYKKYLEED